MDDKVYTQKLLDADDFRHIAEDLGIGHILTVDFDSGKSQWKEEYEIIRISDGKLIWSNYNADKIGAYLIGYAEGRK